MMLLAPTYQMKNIYVYCSREGKPDSVRNPKGSPKRKRPSKRCDCRWCIVLFERDGQWEFRKSLNPEAARHNHPLMRPEEIESNWSQDMIDFIYQLARTQLSTADIRTRVQARYPHVAWKERRFYNRLSEERQRFRQHEATTRTRHLTSLWSKVCMAAAGNDELTSYVEAQLGELLESTCQMARIDPTVLHDPIYQGESHQHENTTMDNPVIPAQQQVFIHHLYMLVDLLTCLRRLATAVVHRQGNNAPPISHQQSKMKN